MKKKDKEKINKSNKAVSMKVQVIKEVTEILRRNGFSINSLNTDMNVYVDKDSSKSKVTKRRGVYIKGSINIQFDNKVEPEELDMISDKNYLDDDYDEDFRSPASSIRGTAGAGKKDNTRKKDLDDD